MHGGERSPTGVTSERGLTVGQGEVVGERQAERGVIDSYLKSISLAVELKMKSREARMDTEMLVARTRVGAVEVWD
ncbi:unnamed protein product [Rangifer tarandus platyrhynchus]|uniref:Uncharacterized protein n=2 Tax=Rangifer tarandus platyrhynchus TaxID=3082113 RepID=A0ACB0F5U5_RANTA|nr:unnamed protein product [Rangifer tarandus platyrhynchus]CAI9707669.1 unnamed protein product [Rangifer tarandus platyrhynchus]